MRRREFVVLAGSATIALPVAVHAQQPAMPVIGVLAAAPSLIEQRRMLAFQHGLSETGYIEGQNARIEYLRAEGRYDDLLTMAADFVRRQVNVIVTPNSFAATRAAMAATKAIPIVFSVTDDPVKLGLVASLNRPDGNATGVNFFVTQLGAKRLGLLRDLIPGARTVAALVNPTNALTGAGLKNVQTAATVMGMQIRVVQASGGDEIDRVFDSLARDRPDALVNVNDPMLTSYCGQIASLAARHAIAAIYSNREFAEAGGLMTYGTNLNDVYRQLGIYTGQILKGAKPADLPVVQSTKFEFVINLKTAKALGLTFPSGLLSIADEVME
jgi:putative ABC transport system substrate-binding protein